MQNKIKKLIIILLIMLIILTIIIIFIMSNFRNDEQELITDEHKQAREYFVQEQNDPSITINGKKPESIKSEGVYFTINNILQRYNQYLNDNEIEALYDILYKQYINQDNITPNNILDKLNKCADYKIDQMYGSTTINYGIYYVQIYNSQIRENLLVNWDTENDTFSISPISEEEFNRITQEGTNIDKERIASIEKNNYNKVIRFKVDEDYIAEKYFYDFIEKAVNNPEEAYSMLDDIYKDVSFANYNDFLQYINSNKEKLVSLDHNNFKKVTDFSDYEEYEKYYQEAVQNKLKNYAQTTNNGIKTYTFEDSYGKYYIFKVTAAMKYTVMMDNYTIPTDDFIKTYNSSSDKQKVVLNIKKFFMGIDDKNYGYSYSLLADSFKNNKYPIKNDFINYAKQNFFEENKIEYLRYEEQNGVYICKINITDATGKSKEQKSLNMIVKLKSGTDFEMSFGTN